MAYGLPGYSQFRVNGGLGKTGSTPGWGGQLKWSNPPFWWKQYEDWPDWARQFELSKLTEPPQSPIYPSVDRKSVGGGGGGGRGVPTGRSPKWMPEMFSQIYGKLGTEQTAHRDWIKELMGLTRGTMASTTADLSRGLGSYLSRTNTPIPAGADIMARRYLSPMTQTLESQLAQLQAMLQQPQSRLGMATGLTQQMAPLFRGRGLPDLSQYWGGGR